MKPAAARRRHRLGLITTAMLLLSACGDEGGAGAVSDGLVAHYPLDGNAEDSVGSTAGVIVGAMPVPDRNGVANGAMAFDGDGDYIEFAHTSALDLVDDFTISAWIDLEPATSDTDFYTIFEKSDPDRGGHSRYGVWVQGGHLWGCFEASDNAQQPCGESTSEVPVNDWHHVAAVRSARRMLLYLDGVEIGNAFVGLEEVSRTPFNAFIGTDRYEPSPAYLRGAIDDVLVHSRALTPGEIEALAEP